MLIRVEIPIDAPGIDALLRRSFESDAEAKLVHDLREDGFLTLGLVATDDEGQVIGYVAFSPVDVQGEDLQWVGMAPLAVDEKYRGQGLARQLVYEGLDSLNEFGYAAVVTLGDPALYSRFGFELAAHHDLRCLACIMVYSVFNVQRKASWRMSLHLSPILGHFCKVFLKNLRNIF